LNVRTPRSFIFSALIAGLVFGLFIGALGGRFFDKRTASGELTNRLEQVNRDLDAAIGSQREAGERASRLQAELLLVTEHARSLEEGIKRLEAGIGSFEARTGNLAVALDRIIDESTELADGIVRAQDSLEESRILLDELGTLLFALPGSLGREN